MWQRWFDTYAWIQLGAGARRLASSVSSPPAFLQLAGSRRGWKRCFKILAPLPPPPVSPLPYSFAAQPRQLSSLQVRASVALRRI